MSKITIITLDGTASTGPKNAEISEYENPSTLLPMNKRFLGGGYPANVAKRLNPNIWDWLALDYKPGFRVLGGAIPVGSEFKIGPPLIPIPLTFSSTAFDIPQRQGSIGRALAMLYSAIPQLTGPFVICGLSQGGWIADLAYEELFRPQGLLYSYRSQCKAIVTFGSPRRPQGHTIPLSGVIQPSGQGFADFPHTLSFGSVPGLVENPPEFMWSFCMLNDPASDSSGVIADVTGAIAEFLYDGDVDSILSLAAQIGNKAAQYVLTPSQRQAIETGIQRWMPFVAGAEGADPRNGNPHAQYNSYKYDAITGRTTGGTAVYGTPGGKTGVDLAVDFLTELGETYARDPVTIGVPKLGYTWWQSPPDTA